MGKALIGVLVAVALGIGAYLLKATDTPSTEDIDADLADVAAQMTEADVAAQRYGGGLIRDVVLARKEILATTHAMLEQKRSSFLRRIDLQYVVGDHYLKPGAPKQLEDISADIESARTELAAAEAKAARYSGGLVQSLSLVTVAMQELTVSQLQLAYYGSKYGVPVPFKQNLSNGNSPKPAGTVVEDKDAL